MFLGPWSLNKSFHIIVKFLNHWYSWIKLSIVGTVCMMI